MTVSSFKTGYDGVSFHAGNAANPPLARGLFGGGYVTSPGVVNVIDYVEIATTGNAIDFGDLTVARYAIGGCSSQTRGLFGGGDLTGPSNQNVPDKDWRECKSHYYRRPFSGRPTQEPEEWIDQGNKNSQKH